MVQEHGLGDLKDKPEVAMVERLEGGHVVKKTHLDGTVDLIDTRAMGGEAEEMPKGYYRSAGFIGTVTVCPGDIDGVRLLSFDIQATCLASICAYLGWVLPANTLYVLRRTQAPSTKSATGP